MIPGGHALTATQKPSLQNSTPLQKRPSSQSALTVHAPSTVWHSHCRIHRLRRARRPARRCTHHSLHHRLRRSCILQSLPDRSDRVCTHRSSDHKTPFRHRTSRCHTGCRLVRRGRCPSLHRRWHRPSTAHDSRRTRADSGAAAVHAELCPVAEKTVVAIVVNRTVSALWDHLSKHRLSNNQKSRNANQRHYGF